MSFIDETSRILRNRRAVMASYFLSIAAFIAALAASFIGVEHRTSEWFLTFTVGALIAFFFSGATFLAIVHFDLDACNEQLDRIRKDAECSYVGNNETLILEYLVPQCESGRLLRIRDTHVRFTSGYCGYKDGTYSRLEQGLRSFLNQSTETKINVIVGPVVDMKLMKSLDSLAKEAVGRVSAYKLRGTAPMLSVLILDYIEGKGKPQVLFGWGKREPGETGAVFRSENDKLVEEFVHYYETLMDKLVSDQVAISSLVADSGPSRPDRFWLPHIGGTNLIVFTEPLCFRIFAEDKRVFIRDVDLNHDEEPEDLINKFEWLIPYKGKVVKSRAYIPGGEVYAKDELQSWLSAHSRPFQCSSIASNHTKWGEGQNSMGHQNLVLLGSVRTNSLVPDVRKHVLKRKRFRYQHENYGISILKPDQNEDRIVGSRYIVDGPRKLSDPERVLLDEDWSKESLVLVTRSVNIDSNKTITSILANQGRGIAAVVSKYLLSDDPQGWQEIEKEIGTLRNPPELPAEFQMIFHVTLDPDEQESRPIEWKLLLYSEPFKPTLA